MGPQGAFFLLTSLLFLGISFRAIAGTPSPRVVVAGWVAMLGFAAQASFFFWLAQELRSSPGSAQAAATMQKVMFAQLAGLMLSSTGVGVQRRKLKARAPSTSGPPAPSPPATS